MARDEMGLTLADLRILHILVQELPRSHSAAAKLVGLNRPRLTRLIERVNQHIGTKDLDWRVGGRFRPPAEVIRLITKYDTFAKEFNQARRGPCVSAGTCAMLLLYEVLKKIDKPMPRLIIIRSRNIFSSLKKYEIDIALVHRQSTENEINSRLEEFHPEITCHELLKWNAFIISKNSGEYGERGFQTRPYWESGSLGERLSKANKSAAIKTDIEINNIPCQSFLHAIELVRRGLIKETVIPDIYLPRPTEDFVIELPDMPISDQLVAVFRKRDQPRWGWLFKRSIWEEAAERIRATK